MFFVYIYAHIMHIMYFYECIIDFFKFLLHIYVNRGIVSRVKALRGPSHKTAAARQTGV